jgi:hypothetical protein
MPSPITGHSGNVEFLLYARSPGGGGPEGADVDALLDASVAEAHPSTAEG